MWAAALAREPGLKAAESDDRAVPARCELGRSWASARCWPSRRSPAAAPSPPPPLAASAPWQERRPQLQARSTFSSRAASLSPRARTASMPVCAGSRTGPVRRSRSKARSARAACRSALTARTWTSSTPHGEHITSDAAHAELDAKLGFDIPLPEPALLGARRPRSRRSRRRNHSIRRSSVCRASPRTAGTSTTARYVAIGRRDAAGAADARARYVSACGCWWRTGSS